MTTPEPFYSASDLIPGRTYQVTASFTDYDGGLHPIGEVWLFKRKAFLPAEDGLTLEIEKGGQLSSIRLQWREETQAGIINYFSDYVRLLPAGYGGARPATPKKKTSLWIKILAGVGISFGLILCLLVGLVVAFEYAISYRPPSSTQDRTGLEYNVISQVNASLNNDIVLEVQFTNHDAQFYRLVSIGLPASYLEGAQVLHSDPAFTDFAGQAGLPDYVIYNYQTEIPARGSLDLRINLKPIKTGDFSGKARICINNPTNCTLETIRSFIH